MTKPRLLVLEEPVNLHQLCERDCWQKCSLPPATSYYLLLEHGSNLLQTTDIKEIISTNVESGEKWILLENFENTVDIRGMLRHHITIDQDFHHGYRLWIITAPNEKFPSPELKKCSKLTSVQALSIREAIFDAFTKDEGGIKEAKCWSGERQLIGGAERHMSRLLYCLG